MALAHGLIVRNLNAVYLQAEGVSNLQDIKDFLLFSQLVIEEIHLHHSFEEQYLFPWIAEYTGEKGIMEVNIAQHHAFEKGLKSFKEYINSTTPEKYDGVEMKRLLDEFGPVLSEHLTDEIGTLLSLDKYGGEKLLSAWVKLEKMILASLGDKVCILCKPRCKITTLINSKHKVLPTGLGARDVTWENGKWKYWPPFPWFIPYLTKYYFARRHKGCWRFSPSTIHGVPRPLAFVKDEEQTRVAL